MNHFDEVRPGGAGGSMSTASAGGSATGGAAGQTSSSTASGGGAGAGGNAGSGTGGLAGAGGTGVTDAASETSIPQLTCHFVFGSPTGGHIKLDDLSSDAGGNRTLSDKFFVLPLLNTTTVRILAQVGGSGDGSYYVYSGSDSGTSGPRQVISANGRLVAAQKLNSRQTVALVIQNGGFDPDSGMNLTQRLALHTFDDSNMGTLPTVAPLTNAGQLGTNGNIDATMATDADGKIAVAANFDVAVGRTRAAYGLYSGTPIDLTTLTEDAVSDNVRPQAVVHLRGVAGYTFIGQNPQFEYEVRDDGSTMTAPPHRQIMTSAFVLMGNLDSAGAINFAAADLGTVLMPKLALYIGQVDPTMVMAFDPAAFVLAKNATSISEVPIGSLNGFSDDMLYFAGPTGLNGTELSILFLDALGRTRAAQKLVDTTQGPVSVAAITPRGLMGGAGGKYHLAWTESMQDGAGRYDIVWYDQIDCL